MAAVPTRSAAAQPHKAHTPASLQDVLSLTSPTFTQGSLSPEHDRLKELVSRLHPAMCRTADRASQCVLAGVMGADASLAHPHLRKKCTRQWSMLQQI